jgi:hypothetical protein
MIEHLLSGDNRVDLAGVTAGEEDLVTVVFTMPENAVAFVDLFQIAEYGADGEQFLIHGADNADFHGSNPWAS